MTRQLILLGAGPPHLHLLAHLAQHPVPGAKVTLVSARIRLVHAPMVADFVTGRHTLDDCAVPLEPLVQQSRVRWVAQPVQDIDPEARAILLGDGSALVYDALSISGQFSRSRPDLELAMPGAKENALLLHPLEAFCTLWPRVTGLADTHAQRVAVIDLPGRGSSDTFSSDGIELALAIRQRLPGCAVTLITGGPSLAHDATAGLRARLARVLRQRNVTVLVDSVTAIEPGEVTLSSGARLACDVPIVLNTAAAPVWAASSGLALDDAGAIAVDACQRSTSHPEVFAPGADTGYSGQASDAALARNLLAVLAGEAPAPLTPDRNALTLLACGYGQGMAQWGRFGAQGRWVGWLKRHLDRQRVAHYRLPQDIEEISTRITR